MATMEITEKNFNKTIEENQIVFIDYWAQWCPPCRAFGPIFEKVASQNTDITFGKCNTEKEQAIAASLQIHSIPTLMAFKEGILVFSQPGLLPEAALSELVKKVRELDMEEVKKEIKDAQAKGEQNNSQSAAAS